MNGSRLFSILIVIGLLAVGCGNSPTTSKTSASATSTPTTSNSFTYPFLTNIGQYMEYGEIYNSYCGYAPSPAQFYDVTGVAVGNNYIFVADDDMEDIEVFDTHGNFVTWFWPYNSAGGEDYSPEGLKADNKGHLYVANGNNSSPTIDEFNISDIIAQTAQTLTCNEVYAFASYGNSAVSGCPYDVDVDSNGNMYVADACYDGIYVIAPNFNYSAEPNEGTNVIAYTQTGSAGINSGNLSSPYGIAVDPSGQKVYVADSGNNVIQCYNGNLNSTGFIGNPAGAASTVVGQFDYPEGVRVDNQGNLIVADTDNGRVQRIFPGGQPVTVLNVIGASGYVEGELYSPVCVAVDLNNNLYVSDNNVATVDVYSPK